jgi:hypothetical protein
MPFGQRLLTQPFPTADPDVEIYFHGQLLLRSEDRMTCEVGVNPVASNHMLTVEVRRKQRDLATQKPKVDLIMMRHVGPLNFRPTGGGGTTIEPGMIIEVVNPPATTQAAWSCEGTDTLDYVNGVGQFEEDFRWILNLEGNLFHDRDLTPSVFGTTDMIRLRNGEFFFRTAFRSPQGFRYERRGGGKGPADLRKIGAIARASVFLVEHQGVVVRFNDGVQERALTLTKGQPGTTYEIYIQHTPLFIQPGAATGHDELAQFYRVIPEIPGTGRFTFAVVDERPPDEKGSPDIPCQVLKLNGPGGGG